MQPRRTALLVAFPYLPDGRLAIGSAKERCVVNTTDKYVNGTAIGPLAQSTWLRVVPWMFQNLLMYVHQR